MNKLLTNAALAAVLAGGASAAQAELSANIGATSNYVWRGVTQTNDEAAIQGGVDYSHDSGFYVGTWVSNVDFSDHELDVYGGYAGEAAGFGYDLGVIFYTYGSSDDLDFTELAASGSWKFLTVGLNYTLDGDADDDMPFSEGDIYYYANASFDLPEDFAIGFTLGSYDFDVPNSSTVDYNHFQVDLTKSAGEWGDFKFSVSKADEESGDDDTKAFVTWAKSF